MGFLAAAGFLSIIYFLFQVICWTLLDCDIELFLASKLGKPVSKLRGKVVWITGASSGIGKELAKCLSKHGVKLVLSARNVRELENTKQECITNSGGSLKSEDILVIPLDMLKFAFHQEALNRVISHFSRLDVLVNNAGRSQRAEWTKIDINVDRELFELDVFSVVHLSRLVVSYYEQHNQLGQVAVTSSTAGLIGAPNSASYTGAKHALHVSISLPFPLSSSPYFMGLLQCINRNFIFISFYQGYFECLRNEKRKTNINIVIIRKFIFPT